MNEAHEGVVRLMPYALIGVKARIRSLTEVAESTSVSPAQRYAATAEIASLTGVLLECKLLPGVTKPLRDWAVEKAGQAAYEKAKALRDQQAAGR